MVIGISMGLVTQFVTQTFVLLGQILGMQSSLGFASMVDPANGQNTPVLGQFYMFLAVMLFLATDGHLTMLNMVVLSFKTLPIGESMLRPVDYYQLAGWFGHMFKAGLNMALAGIIALLTVNLSFGVMTRAAPQLNIFSLASRSPCYSVWLSAGFWSRPCCRSTNITGISGLARYAV